MNNKIRKLFDEATFEPDRLINGWYHPYIPLQVYGEPIRLSITEEQYKKFAELIVKECCDWIDRSPSTESGQLVHTKSFIIANLKHLFGDE